MSTRDDIEIARRFEPTDDGQFLHRHKGKEYKLTRAQAGPLARRLERTQTYFLFFGFFMMFNLLDFVFDLDGPGVWAWLFIRGAAAFLALAAVIFAAVEVAKAAALLKDGASSDIGRKKRSAKPWWQRFASEFRRTGTRNLILQCLIFSGWFVVSLLALSNSPSWLADSLAWLAEAGEDWFVQGVLYIGLAIFFIGFLCIVILSLLMAAVSLKTLHDRFHGAELEGTKGA